MNESISLPLPGMVTISGSDRLRMDSRPRMDPCDESVISIDDPAMTASLQEIADLWAAKFGDKWVEAREIEHDPFWSVASVRLQKQMFLENMQVAVPTTLGLVKVYRLCK